MEYRRPHPRARTWARRALVCGFACVGLAASAPPATAGSPGQLDTTFNVAGPVPGTRIQPLPTTAPQPSQAHAVAVDSLGRTVVAGRLYDGANNDVLVARFTATGELDLDFAGVGWTSFDIAGSDDRALAIALTPTDEIVVTGSTQQTTVDMFVAKLTPTGAMATFGSAGKVVLDLRGGDDVAKGVALHADGRIVVVGSSGSDPNGTSLTGKDAFIVRFSADGTRDSTLTWHIDLRGDDEATGVVTFPADDRIVVAGTADTIGFPEPFLAGVNDGTTAIWSTVSQLVPIGTSARAQALTYANGGFVIAGTTTAGDTFLARLLELDRSLDPSFSGDGLLIDDRSGAGAFDSATSIVAEWVSSGVRYVVGGTAVDAAGDQGFVVSRYDELADRDLDWNGGSHTVTQLSAASETAYGLALRGHKVVVAGSTVVDGRLDVAVARYLAGEPSLSLDASGCASLAGLSLARGETAATTQDCTIGVASTYANGVSLHLAQADGTGTALTGPSAVGDYDGDWTMGSSEFGACLRTTTGALTASWVASADATCPVSNGVPWYPIPELASSLGSLVASSTTVVDGTVALRFGMKADATILAGSYNAYLVISAVVNP